MLIFVFVYVTMGAYLSMCSCVCIGETEREARGTRLDAGLQQVTHRHTYFGTVGI